MARFPESTSESPKMYRAGTLRLGPMALAEVAPREEVSRRRRGRRRLHVSKRGFKGRAPGREREAEGLAIARLRLSLA